MKQCLAKIGIIVTFFALLGNSCNYALAGDDSRFSYYWLNEFFSRGIKSAYAEYSYSSDTDSTQSENIFKNAVTKIEFDFVTKVYTQSYTYEYRQDWASLTNMGSSSPPIQKEKFVSSKVEPWKKVGDMGIYKEYYSKEIPNWLHFEYLDSLFIDQAIFGNPMPILSGLFYSDEFKALKKIRKRDDADSKNNALWNCFEFDNSNNVVEVSRQYLYTLSHKNLTKEKGISNSTMSIRNYEGDLIFIEILIPVEYPAIIEGISIKYNDMKARIYNFEINAVLNKFVPELMANPEELIIDYLLALQKQYDCELSRFATN